MPTNWTLYKVDTSLEAYNLPRLNQEEIDNCKRLITNCEFAFVKKKKKKNTFQQMKVQYWMASQGNFITYIKI